MHLRFHRLAVGVGLLLGLLPDQFKLCLLTALQVIGLRLVLQLHLLDLTCLLHLGLLNRQLRRWAWGLQWSALRVANEVPNVLLAAQLNHLCHGVVDLLRVDQQLPKRRLSQAHLHLHQILEESNLLLLVTRTKTDVRGHVVLVAPLVGVVAHELTTQTEGQRLHLASRQQLEDAKENGLYQCLGEDAGDQLHALLGRVGRHHHFLRCAVVAQCVGVQALLLLGNACALLGHLVHVGQDRQHGLPIERRRLHTQSIGARLANDAADSEVQQVVHVHQRIAVGVGQHRLARVHRQVRRVDQAAGQVGLEALNISHGFSNAHAVPTMGVQHRASGGDLYVVCFLIGEDSAFQAVDQAALCNAVAVIVHQHIFDAQITRGEAVILGIDVVVFVRVAAIRAGQAVFLGVAFAEYVLRCAQITGIYLEPHLLEFRQRDRHHPCDIGAVVQERRSPPALDNELLRRERLDVHPLLFHILRHLGVEQRNHSAHDRRSGLNLVTLLFQHRQDFSRSTLHFLHIADSLADRAPHHSAVLRNQRILECRVQREKAVVLLVEHVVARIRGLGCTLHIFLRDRLKRHRLV